MCLALSVFLAKPASLFMDSITAVMPEKDRRKMRSDATVGTAERKMGLPPGTFRNPDGRDTRSDKKLKNVREE
jgi:hypothetical protein